MYYLPNFFNVKKRDVKENTDGEEVISYTQI